MWAFRSESLTDHDGLRFVVERAARLVSFANILQAWQTDTAFCTQFNGLLADAPFAAFRWETPAVTSATATRPFEFVVLDCPGLARRPEPAAFAERFRASPAEDVVEFANLGGDAILVVPCPRAANSAYGHLAAFVREAPEPQRQALWKQLGETMARRLSDKPVWLSTAGAGVSWLHVRLDDRPKYYAYPPYRRTHFGAHADNT